MKIPLLLFYLLVLFVFAPFISFISLKTINIAVDNLFSVLIWILFFIVLYVKEKKGESICFPKYLKFYFAFIIYTILSDVLLVEKEITIKYLYSNRMASFFLIAIIIDNVRLSKKHIDALLKYITAMVVASILVIFIQQFFSRGFFVQLKGGVLPKYLRPNLYVTMRLPSIYSWTSLLDLGLTFIPFMAILIANKLSNNKNKFLWVWYSAGLLFAFFSRARWVMLNYFILIFIPFYYYKKDFHKKLLNLIFILIFVGFSFSVADYFGAPIYEIVQERILEKQKRSLEASSAGTRIFAFYVFGKLYPKHPVFGTGHKYSADKFTNKDLELTKLLHGKSSQIHVGYLSLFYYYGIIGGLLFILSLYYLMKRLYNRAKFTDYWPPFFGFLGFVIANFTLVNFSLFHYGLIFLLVFDRYYFLSKNNQINSFA